MSDYLSAFELADLVGCKPNQRTMMAKWLEENQWPFVIDRNGVPKVARAYHDKKLGISEGDSSTKYDAGPNLDAFKA
ncbi:hypothetical protein ABH944_007798 [Caballeronia udeis]|uniref:DUF4224 domain-containing protein n=1 Tax=Caballeronia udeis TaxID=1232866 RepID=A0ABW8MVT5_9BURK